MTLSMCPHCGYRFPSAALVNGLVPPHGSPAPASGDGGCPGSMQLPRGPGEAMRLIGPTGEAPTGSDPHLAPWGGPKPEISLVGELVLLDLGVTGAGAVLLTALEARALARELLKRAAHLEAKGAGVG